MTEITPAVEPKAQTEAPPQIPYLRRKVVFSASVAQQGGHHQRSCASRRGDCRPRRPVALAERSIRHQDHPAPEAPGYTNSAGTTFCLAPILWVVMLLSRLIFGARVSLVVGLSAVVISGVIGLLVGLLSGYFGGLLDDIFMRICDIQLSFPTILLALTIMAVLGSGLDKLILVLGLTAGSNMGYCPKPGPSLKNEEFVLAAHATGERQWRIIFSISCRTSGAP